MADVILMVIPVFVGQLACKISKLLCQSTFSGNIISLFDHGLNRCNVALFHRPKERPTGVLTLTGIRNIKHITKSHTITAVIQKSNAGRTSAHIATHTLIPQFIICTSCCIGTLGIDQQLLMVGIFVQTGCSCQERCPFLPASCKTDSLFIRYPSIFFCFCKHGCTSFQV